MIANHPAWLAVDAANWWGPLGWLYRNTPGNLAAGFMQVALAALVASMLWPPARRAIHRFVDAKLSAGKAHERWMAQHTAALFEHATGTKAAPHPAHGDLSPGPDPAGDTAGITERQKP